MPAQKISNGANLGFEDKLWEVADNLRGHIDARNMGNLVDRTHRELSEDDLAKIAGTDHAWRSTPHVVANSSSPDGDAQPDIEAAKAYEDIPGFCKAATLDDIRAHDYVLTSGRYVGLGNLDEDEEPFEEKVARLTTTYEVPAT